MRTYLTDDRASCEIRERNGFLDTDFKSKPHRQGSDNRIAGPGYIKHILGNGWKIPGGLIFNEETPLRLILDLKPDVLVKGNDYKKEEVVGGTEVQKMGGRIVLIPVLEGRSTSGILRELNNS